MKRIKIALAGNPNCGKTTLFNFFTGARQKVGNWAGVTVEKREGVFSYKGFEIEVVDLPGIYSLSPNSAEEIVARNYIIEEKPDIIINILDGTTLERSLLLTTQLIELDANIVIAINMYDEVEKKGTIIDFEYLSSLLGVEAVPISAKYERGLDKLLECLINNKLNKKEIKVNYDEDYEKSIGEIIEILKKDEYISEKYNLRWFAIHLLSDDIEVRKIATKSDISEELLSYVDNRNAELFALYNEKTTSVITEKRFGFIMGIIRECVKTKPTDFTKVDFTEMVDNFILNKWLGFPIFLMILYLTFKITFYFGGIFSSIIEVGVSFISYIFTRFMQDGILKDLIIDGIIGGVGGILVFLPQIVLLFLIIAILEDSGYMARVAFIMDKLMHFLGVHGKSFISLFMGFGCNVPGIMAARTLENEEDRIVTALVNPFMSCSARMPVYILLAGMFFEENATNVIFSMYLIGIVVAVLTAKLLKVVFFNGTSVPFVMELPPYRVPTLKSLAIHMWDRASMFLKKMGGIILVGSILIWTLGYFPRIDNYSENIMKMEENYRVEKSMDLKFEMINRIESLKKSEAMEQSYIGTLGKFIEPFFAPIGFTWREGVSLVTGIFAKEVFVSTISVLYGVGEENEQGLKSKMEAAGINKASSYALMIFVLLYVPCVATIAAVKKETNSYKWTLFSILYSTGIAYALSFVAYKIGSLII